MTRHKMMMDERLFTRVISPQYHRANTGFIEFLCLEYLLQFRESPADFSGESHLYVRAHFYIFMCSWCPEDNL